MANVKEIQDRMKSIRDTMKITNAMYMISSSKMKRAKKALADTEPYFYGMQSAISRILRHLPDMEHRFFDTRPEKKGAERKIGHIVVTADKGLAGAYNHNVLKIAEDQILEEGRHSLYVLGELGRQYFMKREMEDVTLDVDFRYTVQKPSMHRARMIGLRMVDEFLQGSLDEIHIIYTSMESAVTVETQTLQLLPLRKATFGQDKKTEIPVDVHHEEIMLFPSADAVLDSIIPNYVIGTIYGCLVESYSSEQNARMTAMESSTRNAKEMLRALSIQYNRARQTAITQEITEVIGGARAQKNKH
jgi:F-type H+-transporting ATPase subunit gamma